MPTVQAMLPFIQGVINGITSVVSGIVSVIQGVINMVTGIINGNWSQAWHGFQQIVSGAWQAVWGILCGIGINLAQPQSYFDAADLPHGTSLALQGAAVDLAADPAWLAEGLTDFGFDRNLYTFARDGFAPFREEYKAACINLGRRVTFDLPDGSQGAGEAVDVDAEGRLVVRTDAGEQHVFTGEVSVHGIYGAV
jgi:BirA family biotin operon repressor/biotin-[acetyl-CoA-carboxylase] ligase